MVKRAGSATAELADGSEDEVEGEAEPSRAAQIYEELRNRLLVGRIMPGVGISTRVLAQELGVSPMPVREALTRLAAENAFEIRSKRRITIPEMTAERFDDLLHCRLLLEPDAAERSLPFLTRAIRAEMKRIDNAMGVALKNGDVAGYMEGNFAFHFAMYRAQPHRTLAHLIETLWLQFGPYMRVVYGRFGTTNLVDQHQVALAAIEAGDAAALRAAIASDIADGMGLIGRSGL